MTDDTYFNIDFFVAPEVLMEGAQQRKVIHNEMNHGQSNVYRDRHQ